MEKKGLRERQKASRRAKILEIARKKFQNAGYANITIEDIADEANMSAMTIYNYFGTKAGLLLALVGKSDLILIEKLETCVQSNHASLAEGVLEYGRILRKHAMAYLEKPTWRTVVSASIAEGNREFGRNYNALDDVLIEKMQDLIINLQGRDLVPANVDTAALADCLFSLQNIRFFQFIANDHISMSSADEKFQKDIEALQVAFSPVSAKQIPA